MSDWLGQNKIKLTALSLIAGNLLIWGFFLSLPDGKLHLKVYDVGQGDSIFLETAAGYKILIDGGPDNKVLGYLGNDLPFYSQRIDLLILTHPEADHLTGLLEVIKRYQIKTLWISNVSNKTRLFEDWQRLLAEKRIPTTIVYQGDKMIFPDKTVVSVLWPRKDAYRSDLNSNSIVVEVSFDNFDALLTGDADQNSQPYTSDSRPVEVFKVPHHGSKTALNVTFVSLIKPAVSIISVGAKNLYGHPSENTINLLKSVGSKVYRTDKNGTIEVVSNGQHWQVKSRF
jgi:competence protein ComEC